MKILIIPVVLITLVCGKPFHQELSCIYLTLELLGEGGGGSIIDIYFLHILCKTSWKLFAHFSKCAKKNRRGTVYCSVIY